MPTVPSRPKRSRQATRATATVSTRPTAAENGYTSVPGQALQGRDHEPVLQRVAHADGDARREVEQEGVAPRRIAGRSPAEGVQRLGAPSPPRRCRGWQRRWRRARRGTRLPPRPPRSARNARGASRHTPLRKNRPTSRSRPAAGTALPSRAAPGRRVSRGSEASASAAPAACHAESRSPQTRREKATGTRVEIRITAPVMEAPRSRVSRYTMKKADGVARSRRRPRSRRWCRWGPAARRGGRGPRSPPWR